MRKLKVYISSTFKDLKNQRQYIVDTIVKDVNGPFEINEIMEVMGEDGYNSDNIDVCLKNVRGADIYIILVGNRYGSIIENKGKSYTELEFDTACSIKEKKYLIFKFDLRESNLLDLQNSDIDSEKKEHFEKFTNKVFAEGKRAYKIENNEQFITYFNETLRRANNIFFSIANLQINPISQINIDRHDQVKQLNERKQSLERKRLDAVLMDQTLTTNQFLESYNVTCSNGFEEDDIDSFYKMMRYTLDKNTAIDNFQISWVNMDQISLLLRKSAITDGMLDYLLHLVAHDIVGGGKIDNITFSDLANIISDQSNQISESKYIGFIVEGDDKNHVENWIKLIDAFCTKLNQLLISSNYKYALRCLVCFLPENENLMSNPGNDIGDLSKISHNDLIQWINTNKLNEHVEMDPMELLINIFENLENPLTFKYCKTKLNLLNKINLI